MLKMKSIVAISVLFFVLAGNAFAEDKVVIIPMSDRGGKPTGDALDHEVLDGKTFSSEAGTDQIGTMPNNGAVTITPGTTAQNIPEGYHNGSGSVAGDAALVSDNLKAGETIFGVPGSPTVVDTLTGDAEAKHILKDKKAYVNGELITGTTGLFWGCREGYSEWASGYCAQACTADNPGQSVECGHFCQQLDTFLRNSAILGTVSTICGGPHGLF
jgi:hypothetical protein